jgi:hypothetical protein
MDEFDKRVAMLAALGAEVTFEEEYRPRDPPRSPHPLKLFKSVKLPLTAREWCELFMSDGAFYMGGCCGTMSALQDEICHNIRMDSGWFSIEKLAEIAETMIQHDCGEDDYAEVRFAKIPKSKSLGDLVATFQAALEGPERTSGNMIDAWQIMALIWHITKDHYGPKIPQAYGDHMSELEKATSLLARGFQSLSYEHLFRGAVPGEDLGSLSQHKVGRAMTLYRLFPAWKEMNEKIGELNLGPLEGFALIDKEKGPEEVCINGRGYCIFETQAEVDALMALWRQQDKEYEVQDRQPIDERIGVRRVRVTAEKGIEFLT